VSKTEEFACSTSLVIAFEKEFTTFFEELREFIDEKMREL